MFPLSTVLFPGATMPLHVFEPRYRALMRDSLAGDHRFGVILIERGSEVGGGDVRAALGTRGLITKAIELPDGRWLLQVVGESVIEVEQWLPDDPYPVAVVRDHRPQRMNSVPPPPPAARDEEAGVLVAAATQRLRRARALLAEHGGAPPLPPDLALDGDGDAEAASWELCAAAPVSAYDAQRLLGTEGTGPRARLLARAHGGARARSPPHARLGVSLVGRPAAGRRNGMLWENGAPGGSRVAITPTREQFTEFAHGTRDGEVVMINLLHFARPEAEGGEAERSEGSAAHGDAGAGTTGAAAYRDYSDQVVAMVEARGGRVIWTGRPEHVLIGDAEGDDWDLVALVSYPSRAAFIDMVTSPTYEEAHTHRERGLDRTVLLACEPLRNALAGETADA